MPVEIKVPALGESVTTATVGKWLKQPGEAVKADEGIVELETDKVSVEVPAPAAGCLESHVVKEGEHNPTYAQRFDVQVLFGWLTVS